MGTFVKPRDLLTNHGPRSPIHFQVCRASAEMTPLSSREKDNVVIQMQGLRLGAAAHHLNFPQNPGLLQSAKESKPLP